MADFKLACKERKEITTSSVPFMEIHQAKHTDMSSLFVGKTIKKYTTYKKEVRVMGYKLTSLYDTIDGISANVMWVSLETWEKFFPNALAD